MTGKNGRPRTLIACELARACAVCSVVAPDGDAQTAVSATNVKLVANTRYINCGPPRLGPAPSTRPTLAILPRRALQLFACYATVNETGVEPLVDASVTTRFITPMPLSRAARSTTLPDGAEAALGSVHVEFAAQRAVIPTTRTGVLELTFSVQPAPLPRPSAIVTGTWTVPATEA